MSTVTGIGRCWAATSRPARPPRRAPLLFANAEDFKRRALASLNLADEPVEWLILNAEVNVEVDLTSVDALDEVREELERRDIVLCARPCEAGPAERSGVVGLPRPRGGGPCISDAAHRGGCVHPLPHRPPRPRASRYRHPTATIDPHGPPGPVTVVAAKRRRGSRTSVGRGRRQPRAVASWGCAAAGRSPASP